MYCSATPCGKRQVHPATASTQKAIAAASRSVAASSLIAFNGSMRLEGKRARPAINSGDLTDSVSVWNSRRQLTQFCQTNTPLSGLIGIARVIPCRFAGAIVNDCGCFGRIYSQYNQMV